jgi:hypothetical protein
MSLQNLANFAMSIFFAIEKPSWCEVLGLNPACWSEAGQVPGGSRKIGRVQVT